MKKYTFLALVSIPICLLSLFASFVAFVLRARKQVFPLEIEDGSFSQHIRHVVSPCGCRYIEISCALFIGGKLTPFLIRYHFGKCRKQKWWNN